MKVTYVRLWCTIFVERGPAPPLGPGLTRCYLVSSNLIQAKYVADQVRNSQAFSTFFTSDRDQAGLFILTTYMYLCLVDTINLISCYTFDSVTAIFIDWQYYYEVEHR